MNTASRFCNLKWRVSLRATVAIRPGVILKIMRLPEAQHAWLRQRLAIDVGQQRRARFIVRELAAGVDVTIARSVLEWNTPLPAGTPRRGAGVRVRDAVRELGTSGRCEGGRRARGAGAPGGAQLRALDRHRAASRRDAPRGPRLIRYDP